MSSNEPQTLRDGNFLATKILDAEYKPASLDDVMKTCEILHVEEQHQLKTLLQKYEHLFDGKLGEFIIRVLGSLITIFIPQVAHQALGMCIQVGFLRFTPSLDNYSRSP
jgi:hypothetical protein